MENKELKYQVWRDYGSGGWIPNDFKTFTECIEFMKNDASGVRYRITKIAEDETYTKFI